MLKSRKAKHGWVGIGAQRSHGKPNGNFVASVVAPGSGAEPRIVLGGGFPTREVINPLYIISYTLSSMVPFGLGAEPRISLRLRNTHVVDDIKPKRCKM